MKGSYGTRDIEACCVFCFGICYISLCTSYGRGIMESKGLGKKSQSMAMAFGSIT